MNKPTPGPWSISGSWILHEGNEIKTHIGRVVRYQDQPDKANAALIIAAVNACFAVNPENPMAAAEAVPAMRDIIIRLARIYGGMYAPTSEYRLTNDARELLAKLEAK